MPRLTLRMLLLAALAAGICASASRADLIFLKDGHVLQGTVRRETTIDVDPVSKDVTLIPKGFFSIDDGPRRVYFSPQQVKIVEKLPAPAEERFIRNNPRSIINPRPMPGILDIAETGEWKFEKGERELYVRTKDNPRVGLIQAPFTVSPHYVGMVAVTKFRWYATYLTKEFPPEDVLKLLKAHPDFKENPKAKKPLTPGEIVTRRLKLCDFLAQAGWFDLAEKELDQLLADVPESKERVASGKALLGKLRVRDDWERIKTIYGGGRYEEASKLLASFPLDKATDQMTVDHREMKDRIAFMTTFHDAAKAALDECIKDATTPRGKELAAAAEVIKTEMHPSTAERLDAFLGQVRDAARRKAEKATPSKNNEELLALAVTGWLLGSVSSESNAETAGALWKARRMTLEYLAADVPAARRQVMADYEKNVTPKAALDEIAQMVPNLPPVLPNADTSAKPREMTVGMGRNAVTYTLRLPPEYTHSRPYPLLVVLHNGDEKSSDHLERWAKIAADNGYILAAPTWQTVLGGSEYQYTAKEQDAALDTIRDVRRRFRVDCDRIFVSGNGEGGKMAMDLGLAHPDLFAGVLPMNGGAEKFPKAYWRNGQYTGFYVVAGTRAGDSHNQLKEHFLHWVERGFPAIWVEYKGRGTEFFSGELPAMFDWMRHQKRKFPMRQAGTDGGGGTFGTEFCTMRSDDNRFFWVGTTDIGGRNQIAPGARWSNLVTPAALTARIDPASNDVYVRTQGVNDVVLWFGRNPLGANAVDFDRPVTVIAGNRVLQNKKKIAPSLETMLEEIYTRADRTQLYLAKVRFSLR